MQKVRSSGVSESRFEYRFGAGSLAQNSSDEQNGCQVGVKSSRPGPTRRIRRMPFEERDGFEPLVTNYVADFG